MRFSINIFTVSILAFCAMAFAAPVPLDEAATAATETVELESRATTSRVTYYGGWSLKNPACGGSDPSPSSMIAAVKKGGKFGCGDTLRIKSNGKSVTVTVIDYCAGCSNTAVDLSSGAFKRLAKLKQGVVSGKVTKM